MFFHDYLWRTFVFVNNHGCFVTLNTSVLNHNNTISEIPLLSTLLSVVLLPSTVVNSLMQHIENGL